jgi:uncharacterized protein YoxC
MSPAFESKNYKIDEHSQRILLRLGDERGEFGIADPNPYDYLSTPVLVAATGFDGSGAAEKVKYRLEEHLIPAGLVEEKERKKEQDTRKFRLTMGGKDWLDNHEELGYAATLGEAIETAEKAAEDAQSAKESVQNYRSTVSELSDDVSNLESVVEELDDSLSNGPDLIPHRNKEKIGDGLFYDEPQDAPKQKRETAARPDLIRKSFTEWAEEVESRFNKLENTVGGQIELNGKIVPHSVWIDRHNEKIGGHQTQLDNIERDIKGTEHRDGLKDSVEELTEKVDKLSERVRKIEEKQKQGIWSRLSGRFEITN